MRHYLHDGDYCENMWSNDPKLTHPMSFRCRATPDADVKKVVADGRVMPHSCPLGPDSGDLDLPKRISEDDAMRLQVKHCYRNWMAKQKPEKRNVSITQKLLPLVGKQTRRTKWNAL